MTDGLESEATKMRKPELKFPRCRPPNPDRFSLFSIAISFDSGDLRERKRPARRERRSASATGWTAGKREPKSILSRSDAGATRGETIEDALRFPDESGQRKGAL